MSTFHTTFCLTGFCAQRGDIEAAHGPSKLSFAGFGGGMLIINPEDTGFIAVKDHGLTVFFDIATGGFKIGKCGF